MQLKPNTAATITIGRLLDYQYGKEPALGVAYNTEEIVCRIIKDGAPSVKSLTADNWSELAGGFYSLDLTAEDVGDAGELIVAMECQYDFLPWQIRIDVVTSATIDISGLENKTNELHARFFNKVVKSATEITIYDADAVTPLFVQRWSVSGASEIVEAAI